MANSPNLIVLIVLTVVAVIFLNLLLIASVRTSAKRNDGKTIGKMLKAVQDPFKDTYTDLDELADLVEEVKEDQSIPENSGSNL